MARNYLKNSEQNTTCRLIVFSPAAKDDIDHIIDFYIIEIGYKKAAARFLQLIKEKIDLISDYPFLGRRLNQYGIDVCIRMIIADQYAIIYQISDESIKVLRILDTRSNYLEDLLTAGYMLHERE